MKDLTNPSILTHQEIKNIMGGFYSMTCTLQFSNGQEIQQHCTSQAEKAAWVDACTSDPTCINYICGQV